MKKLLCILLAGCLMFSLAACDSSNNPSGTPTQGNDKIAVFYYTYEDTYVSSVRTAMDKALDTAGVAYTDYDSANDQATQDGQVDEAIKDGATVLIVNLVDSASDSAARNVIAKAEAAGIPIIFFNRSISEDVATSYNKCVYVGTDNNEAGHLQGELIGNYLVSNYSSVDLNGDGIISYVMFKGQAGNVESDSRTTYSQMDADAILNNNAQPSLRFYDEGNTNKYLLDESGSWSRSFAVDAMKEVLSACSEANGNMVELVIANNEEMALGAISVLQEAGYNVEGGTTIPVFGVDATTEAQAAISAGSMTGTVKQDAEGMAKAIINIAFNFKNGANTFASVDQVGTVVGSWRINIPYSRYQ